MNRHSKFITLMLIVSIIFSVFVPYTVDAKGKVHVRGYFRKDGTYVKPHYRSAPDGIKSNNWSYCGNINPYTGKVGTTDCFGSQPSSPKKAETPPANKPSYTPSFTPNIKIPNTQDTKKNKTGNTPILSSSKVITIGSTKEDVIRVMGQPSEKSSSSFTYGYSLIFFDFDSKVSGWSNIGDTTLKVSLGEKKAGAKPFTISSSKQAVIEAMGTPDTVDSSSYTYGYSLVFFDLNERVSGWSNIGDTKLRATLGNKDPKSKGFNVGSTKEEVIKAMGTPDAVDEYSYSYEYSLVFFDSNGVVTTYSNISNNLKIK